MLLTTLCVLLVIAAIASHASKRRMRAAVANLDGPFCVPLLGAVHRFFEMDPKNFFKRSYQYAAMYGLVLRIWALNRLIVISADNELNEQLLASQQHIAKQRNYRILHQWLGVGLLLSDGKKWFARRKILTPAFHFKILEEFVEIMEQQADTFVARLAREAGGAEPHAFDVYPYVCLAALDIIAETSMGTSVHAQSDGSTAYAAAVNEMTQLMARRLLRVYLHSEVMFSILHPLLKLRQMQLIRIMHAFTIKVIEERRRTLQQTRAETATPLRTAELDEEFSIPKKRQNLLDLLLQSSIDGKPLSNEDIREEVDTFMFEGHDTTTSALSFALHLIARHPTVQTKMLAEIDAVFGSDKSVTMRALNELKYAECVIKETLRLYPSVPMIGREIREDFHYTHSKLGVGTIPAGTEFFINLHGMLHSTRHFESPDDFVPERHENSAPSSAFALIPFSAGPRNCIGQKFAMLELKTLLTKILLAYELLPLGAPVQPVMNIVLRSANGFQLGMRRRVAV